MAMESSTREACVDCGSVNAVLYDGLKRCFKCSCVLLEKQQAIADRAIFPCCGSVSFYIAQSGTHFAECRECHRLSPILLVFSETDAIEWNRLTLAVVPSSSPISIPI